MNFYSNFVFYLFFLNTIGGKNSEFKPQDLRKFRHDVKSMFYHAYDSYIRYAYPYDELRPLTCDGHDTWGSYSLTLIDALDTLGVMGNSSEFQRVYHLISERENFDADINVSVFETNIRIVGGLLSSHLMAQRLGVDVGQDWPCDGSLLRLAQDAANRLLPAFDTPTGMPFGTVNLRHGVPPGETPVTCTAGVGTMIIEFGAISRLTGDPIYEEVALRALHYLYNTKSKLGLFGNHIDVVTGRWTSLDAGIGAGVDSYFEYLAKGSFMFQRPELMDMFQEARKSIDEHLRHEDWYLWKSMNKGHISMAVFQSLEAFWPGVLVLVGDLDAAQKTMYNYHQILKQYGFHPEFYNIPESSVYAKRTGYPLRPEFVESLMYLYQATRDSKFLEMGVDLLKSIEHSAWTPCGYATIKDVRDHTLENRMESFFLAETTKYLYLIFDDTHWLHHPLENGAPRKVRGRSCIVGAGGYFFNTEAHPIDAGSFGCCSGPEDRDKLMPEEDIINLILDPSVLPGHVEDVSKRFSLPNAKKSDVKLTQSIDPEKNLNLVLDRFHLKNGVDIGADFLDYKDDGTVGSFSSDGQAPHDETNMVPRILSDEEGVHDVQNGVCHSVGSVENGENNVVNEGICVKSVQDDNVKVVGSVDNVENHFEGVKVNPSKDSELSLSQADLTNLETDQQTNSIVNAKTDSSLTHTDSTLPVITEEKFIETKTYARESRPKNSIESDIRDDKYVESLDWIDDSNLKQPQSGNKDDNVHLNNIVDESQLNDSNSGTHVDSIDSTVFGVNNKLNDSVADSTSGGHSNVSNKSSESEVLNEISESSTVQTNPDLSNGSLDADHDVESIQINREPKIQSDLPVVTEISDNSANSEVSDKSVDLNNQVKTEPGSSIDTGDSSESFKEKMTDASSLPKDFDDSIRSKFVNLLSDSDKLLLSDSLDDSIDSKLKSDSKKKVEIKKSAISQLLDEIKSLIGSVKNKIKSDKSTLVDTNKNIIKEETENVFKLDEFRSRVSRHLQSYRNVSRDSDFSLLSCPIHFAHAFIYKGQMINTKN